MKHYEVVCAVIYNDKNEIFCTQRGPGRALEGKWEFPGGKVEINETHEQTIIREIQEELDSLVEPLNYLGAFNKNTQTFESLDKRSSISCCMLILGKSLC